MSTRVVLSIILLAPLLMGAKSACTLWGAAEPELTVIDTWCDTAAKRQWSVDDTPETIRAARAWNGAIDERCSKTKKAS